MISTLLAPGVKFKSPDGEDFGAAFEFPLSMDDIREVVTGKDSTSRCQSTWTPLPMQKLDSTSDGAKHFFPLPPGVLPSSATEVLVFVILEVDPVGDAKEEELVFTVSTRDSRQQSGGKDSGGKESGAKTVLPYAMHVHLWSHKTIVSRSSHNFWLPLTTERYVIVEPLHGGPVKPNCTLYLTGYR